MASQVKAERVMLIMNCEGLQSVKIDGYECPDPDGSSYDSGVLTGLRAWPCLFSCPPVR